MNQKSTAIRRRRTAVGSFVDVNVLRREHMLHRKRFLAEQTCNARHRLAGNFTSTQYVVVTKHWLCFAPVQAFRNSLWVFMLDGVVWILA